MKDLKIDSLKKKLTEREMDEGPPPNPYENIEQEVFEKNKDLKTSFYLERLRFGNKILILMTIFSCINSIIYVSHISLILSTSMTTSYIIKHRSQNTKNFIM